MAALWAAQARRVGEMSIAMTAARGTVEVGSGGGDQPGLAAGDRWPKPGSIGGEKQGSNSPFSHVKANWMALPPTPQKASTMTEDRPAKVRQSGFDQHARAQLSSARR